MMVEIVDLALLIGRILFGGYFVFAGIGHFTNRDQMVPYAESKGVPVPGLAVPGTGVLLLAGGLSVLIGLLPYWGLGALLAFLVGVTPMMHDFWNVEDPEARMAEQTNFLKNTALAGAALMLYALGSTWAYVLA